MMNTSECLAKADHLDRMAQLCPTEALLQAYRDTALKWRNLAVLAAQQAGWAAKYPGQHIQFSVPRFAG